MSGVPCLEFCRFPMPSPVASKADRAVGCGRCWMSPSHCGARVNNPFASPTSVRMQQHLRRASYTCRGLLTTGFPAASNAGCRNQRRSRVGSWATSSSRWTSFTTCSMALVQPDRAAEGGKYTPVVFGIRWIPRRGAGAEARKYARDASRSSRVPLVRAKLGRAVQTMLATLEKGYYRATCAATSPRATSPFWRRLPTRSTCRRRRHKALDRARRQVGATSLGRSQSQRRGG